MNERRTVQRIRLKVIHRHRVGRHRFRRVSELVFIDGCPKAILEWVNAAGIRAPLYLAELDPLRLRKIRVRHIYYYDGLTVDPRFEDMERLPQDRYVEPETPATEENRRAR
jgi:hypothetical protein